MDNTLRKAAEMALEALLTCGVDYDYDENSYDTFDAEDVTEAIDALRTALAQNPLDIADRAYFAGKQAGIAETLAQPEQEPVVWIRLIDWNLLDYEREGYIPLYTTPASKTWVGLTDDDFFSLKANNDYPYHFAKAIEAKLKEKNT